mmetsp:Transcript_123034/g.244892  ORF Transcript_123034/g.244892 Transcript_123034/m.244892 type:complete len:223 (-) Transcript_123034:32-700(-)
MPPRLASSFYVDCSVADLGLPEGTEPLLRCPDTGSNCRPHREECLRLRRTLANHTMVKKKMFCWGERTFIHFTDGDFWLRCCVRGEEGKESAQCEALYPLPPAPPPGAEKGKKGLLGKVVGHIKDAVKDLASSLLGGCGQCYAYGSYPAPICLKTAYGGGHCVQWGLPGELYPQDPKQGTRGYRVFQLGMPAIATSLVLAPQDVPHRSLGRGAYCNSMADFL